jgi:CRISPR-associated protein Cas1
MIFLEYGLIDVVDGAFVLIDVHGVRTQIPIGGVSCIMLEPGTRITHAAVRLAALVGCLLVWVGEGGVRLYSVGHPGGCRSDRLLYQAALALDSETRLKVARKMYAFRFQEEIPISYSLEQLKGFEGARVKKLYYWYADAYGIQWTGRKYNPKDWHSADVPNRCLSAATSCLYGVCESAILASGYSPAIGFIHCGKPLSFVYDIADLFKFETVVPAAFETASQHPVDVEREVRYACRDMFRKTKLLEKIIPLIHEILNVEGVNIPDIPDDAVLPPLDGGERCQI